MDEDIDSLREVLSAIAANREQIRAAQVRSNLGIEVLPTLASFDATVDVRVRVADGVVKASVPVVVAHLDTDGANQEVWFQMTQEQLERLIAKLGKTAEQMKTAEAWSTDLDDSDAA